MELLAAATETGVIGVGMFAWWGAYLSTAKKKYFYKRQYQGRLAEGYDENDYIPYGALVAQCCRFRVDVVIIQRWCTRLCL